MTWPLVAAAAADISSDAASYTALGASLHNSRAAQTQRRILIQARIYIYIHVYMYI